ncbi:MULTISPECIES: MerR family transcriptional regulator [unclassified Enterococcus]|uniref:MerR family transcriptional regulator n=1 Tax=unclassified Enterococcus TaxID=2608891 RepID=UPI00155425A9|nr:MULTISPECIES: MerR family transcriptional regulator [unclassified Enterococcus]MBS7575959.1 MerR family transcriptional regulator [Enterococcus sp. MMGLQ5-2]MBS7583192.1 MerR family transcriptional regulator [Enterococcus sp. MMGLQ5-1]NPD11052.1 MerR family transcriptional regulator [Enterococcus sp. MMGLQ5-1]NPD35795.1 MerR family transcriptional regulator [Enterococcus sp. MMGLQ5-2]
MFKIGDFSKLTNLTVRALRHYEELELLLPERIDDVTNYRYYSTHQLTTVNKIKMLQQIGLPLKTIKEVIQSNDTKLLEYHYNLREAEIRDELDALTKMQNIIDQLREKMKEGTFIEKYNVKLKEIPKRKVMAIRKKISSYNDEYELWTSLHEEFIKQSVKMANPPLGMTIYHDREYKEANIDIEVQSNIIGDYTNTDDVKFYEDSGFLIASVTFNGSYEQMPEVTQAIASWIEANNYVICGPMINIPYISPAQSPNPDSWITEAGYVVCKC